MSILNKKDTRHRLFSMILKITLMFIEAVTSLVLLKVFLIVFLYDFGQARRVQNE